MMRVVQVFLVTLIVGIPKARAIDGAVGADGVRNFSESLHSLSRGGEAEGSWRCIRLILILPGQTPVNCGSRCWSS